MKLYNLKDKKEEVSFSQAVILGLGKKQGLFFPKDLPIIDKNEIKLMMKMDFITRSTKLLHYFLHQDISFQELKKCIQKSFSFTNPIIKKINNNIACLELFHGPTLAFKDFGARFMAQILSYWNQEKYPMTILTATSGDTGAAVANAFYNIKNIKVVVLYPKGKISSLQEKMFCTLGNNVSSIAIDGSFDDCQNLVKKSFNDQEITSKIRLNSANSINISRLLAQICYYFEAFALLNEKQRKKLIISVPCGNFGNLTAGLFAKSLGLPIKSFIAATNENDTVPRYLKTGIWDPKNTISTLSNAMDISQPNNWPRVEEIFKRKKWNLKYLEFGKISEKNTKLAMLELFKLKYISEPHAAIAYKMLQKKIKKNYFGLFLGTAHPAKFKETVEKILKINIFLPKELKTRESLPNISKNLQPNFLKLKKFLLST